MCGIIGYVGKREALPILLDGLTRMEYRGYDSAGVAVVSPSPLKKGVPESARAGVVFPSKKRLTSLHADLPAEAASAQAGDGGAPFIKGESVIKCVKAKGKVAELKEKCRTETLEGAVGIGHTRWATHGEPSERNAHPLKDCTGDIFVAHNGIIENYQSLKEKLEKKGHRFVSETDTEVIAHLIEEYAKKENDFPTAVRLALKDFHGAFGIVVLSRKHPGVLIAARFGSPLILGIGKAENIVASDATAILPMTNSVIYLNDNDMVILSGDAYEISDFRNPSKGLGVNGKKLHRPKTTIEWKSSAAELSGFPHFMIKEITEQPQSLRDTMRGRLLPNEGTVKFGGLEPFEKRMRELKHITLAAMGTASFTCLIGEYAIEELAGITAKREIGSEFAFRSSTVNTESALLAVSQSGETADTLNAIREAKRRGALTLGIVNVVGSTMAREVDGGIYNHVGPEIAVASTKATTSQALLQVMFALYLGRLRGTVSKSEGQAIIAEMQKLPKHIEKILKSKDKIKALAKKYKKCEDFFLLGRKYNVSSALEGALKLKECAYTHAEGCSTTELKHGPISLIQPNLPSIVIVPEDGLYEKNKSSVEELKARKGPVIAITTEGNKELAKITDTVLYIPKTIEMLTPILAIIPMQLFAYYMAVERGNDVDKPRNLAKSVTVE